MTDADLLDALRDCYDPVLRRNVVELGMVKAAHLTVDHDAPGASVRGVEKKYVADVTLLARDSDDDAGQMLVAQIENRLAGLSYISRTHVMLLPPAFPILDAKVK